MIRDRVHRKPAGTWGALPPNISGRHGLISTSGELKMRDYYGIAIVQVGSHSLVPRVKKKREKS